VIGDKDADGFYWGEVGSRSGYVPCNMVSEVQVRMMNDTLNYSQSLNDLTQVDDEHVAEELFKEQLANQQAAGAKAKPEPKPRQNDAQIKRKVALYDYDPTELSPNVDSDAELAFSTGDLLAVHGDMDDDGFFLGEILASSSSKADGQRGKRGLVPSNFLTDAPPGYDPEQLKGWISEKSKVQPRVLGQDRRW